MRQILSLLLALWCVAACQSKPLPSPMPDSPKAAPRQVAPDTILAGAVYTAADSVEVEAILRDESLTSPLAIARHFIGRPYVAYTLEVADPERIVVNLRELDCTTLVETVLALYLTKQEKGTTLADYCKQLARVRYFAPSVPHYLARQHYATQWLESNIAKGLVQPVTLPARYTAKRVMQLGYMSQHADNYKILSAHPEWVDSIARLERQYSGKAATYLPEQYAALGKSAIGAIHDGDIVFIVTTKAGLDYSHLGFAVWGKDGRLHLLNASSLHHKVVEEPMTLYQYLQKQRSAIGLKTAKILAK